MTDIPAVAIWFAVVLLLWVATLPVFAMWVRRTVADLGRAGTRAVVEQPPRGRGRGAYSPPPERQGLGETPRPNSASVRTVLAGNGAGRYPGEEAGIGAKR